MSCDKPANFPADIPQVTGFPGPAGSQLSAALSWILGHTASSTGLAACRSLLSRPPLVQVPPCGSVFWWPAEASPVLLEERHVHAPFADYFLNWCPSVSKAQPIFYNKVANEL